MIATGVRGCTECHETWLDWQRGACHVRLRIRANAEAQVQSLLRHIAKGRPIDHLMLPPGEGPPVTVVTPGMVSDG